VGRKLCPSNWLGFVAGGMVYQYQVALAGERLLQSRFLLNQHKYSRFSSKHIFILLSFPLGPINLVLQHFGVLDQPYDFFRSETGTRLIVSFIQFWMWYGQTTIVLVSGILSIDDALFESAMVDGANDGQIFRKITLPLLKPILLYTLVTSLIGGLQMFDIPFLLTNGNPNNSVLTITMFIYNQAFTGSRNFNVAATASVLLLVLSIVLSTLLFQFFKENSKVGRK
jgi:multiple sugar transport system permease protein